jgi:hypothetical protein
VFDEKLAKRKYHAHKGVAKQRNILFDLSYDEWINIWMNSGKYHLRGAGQGKYCMSRINDTGPYSISNVFIQSHAKNVSDAQLGRKKPIAQIKHWKQAWYKNRNCQQIYI